MTRGEYLIMVVFWKLLCLVMAGLPVWAMLTQPRPPTLLELVVIPPLSFFFLLMAIFTRLGD